MLITGKLYLAHCVTHINGHTTKTSVELKVPLYHTAITSFFVQKSIQFKQMQITIIYMFTSEFAVSAVDLWSFFVYLTLNIELQKVLPSLTSIVMWCNMESAVMQ